MRNRLYINILTNANLISRKEAKKLLEIWIENLKSFIPQKFGNYEPLKNDFDPDNLFSVIDFWDYPFLVKRKTPKMNGSIFMGGGKNPTHGWIHVILEFCQEQQEEVVNFVKKVAVAFDVEFAFIHLLTESEFHDRYTNGIFSVRSGISLNTLSVTTHELKKGIPDIYWGTIFGKSYLRLFGESKFNTLPSFALVERLETGQYYVQVSEEISDLETDFHLVSRRRNDIKEHLNSNAFSNPRFGSFHQYSIPHFDL